MRNNRPFLREPPYRRRETLIERLGFLLVQIPRLSSLSPRQAIGFKQAGQAAGKDRALARVISASAIAYTREKPQRKYSTSEFRLRAPLAWSREIGGKTPPIIVRVYTPYFILTLYEYILLVIIVPYFYYTLLVYILLYRIYSFRIYPLKLFTSFIV